MVGAYRDAGGRGRLHLQVHVSWAPEEDEAQRIAHEQWRSNVFPPPACWDIDHVDTFDAVSADVTPEQVRGAVLVSSDLGRLADRIAELVATGFDEVAIHHVGQEQEAFVEAFGTHVLPRLDVEPAPPVTPVTRTPAADLAGARA